MARRMLAVVGVLAAAVPARTQYRIIELGTLGGADSPAADINDRGQIVGFSRERVPSPPFPWVCGPCTAEHACLWQNGVMIDLGALAGD